MAMTKIKDDITKLKNLQRSTALPHEFYITYLAGDLSSYDPYDIWKTKIGMKAKSVFYKNRLAGFLPALFLSMWDTFINNRWRIGYKKQEFPIVRALAASSLLNLYETSREEFYLNLAKEHLEWLLKNYSKGYSGFCWGANMPWASKNGNYEPNTPFITNTPYILEGLLRYQKLTNTNIYQHVITSIFDFINIDLYKHLDTEDTLCLSYSPIQESRIVINANSYALYALSLLQPLIIEKSEIIRNNILRLYKFITTNQNSNGSWWYYADSNKGNFIDCFHTCFILKNLIKASNHIDLPGVDSVVDKGYDYLISNFYNQEVGLFKRFSTTDKFNPVKFDLYDNAEAMHLAVLKSDHTLCTLLNEKIRKNFVKNNDIYSIIDIFNVKRNRNMLRWAVMPYIYALSCAPTTNLSLK